MRIPLSMMLIRECSGININIDPNEYKAIDWGDGDISRFRYSDYPSVDFGFNFCRDRNIYKCAYNYRSSLLR